MDIFLSFFILTASRPRGILPIFSLLKNKKLTIAHLDTNHGDVVRRMFLLSSKNLGVSNNDLNCPHPLPYIFCSISRSRVIARSQLSVRQVVTPIKQWGRAESGFFLSCGTGYVYFINRSSIFTSVSDSSCKQLKNTLADCSLQRHNTENAKQIFPGKELRGYSPNSGIHVSVSDLYIPLIGLPILLQENRWPERGNK
jgi:hypothetical protein